jgi:hypothetical protein
MAGPLTSPPPPVVAQAAASAAKGKRRKPLLLLGAGLLIGGLVAGGLMVLKSSSNYESAVKSLARAPVGCTTTLVFDNPATFIVYVETTGKLAELSGDCEANGTEYSRSGDKLPKVSLILTDTADETIELTRDASASYNAAGYIGTQARALKIDKAGTYRLNVESPDSDFAIAIGKNPRADSESLKQIGLAVGAAGAVLGVLCLLLGLRRRRPMPTMIDVRNPVGPLPGWPPGPYAGGPPTAPPLHPGYRVEAAPHAPPAPSVAATGQAPIRVPEQPLPSVFAPPTLPTPQSAPPSVPPSPSIESSNDAGDSGWAKPDD